MRLLSGAVLGFVLLNLLVTVAAQAETLAPAGDGTHVEWLAVDTRPTPALPQENVHPSVNQQPASPVLLPLPPEGWAGLSVIVSMLTVRGLRRARLIES